MGGNDCAEVEPMSATEYKANIAERYTNAFINFFEKPAIWFRKNIVEPNQKKSYWYHMQLRRVPTIDQCYTDDVVCIYEANQQFKRDRDVDAEIVGILRYRYNDCLREEFPDCEKCEPLKQQFLDAETNWFIKYGDMGWFGDVEAAFMKQKHRMIWERRHGPVGTGMKKNDFSAEPCD